MVKSLLFSLSFLTVTAAHAEMVPALVFGESTSVALQDIVSVKFTDEQILVCKTDGTFLTQTLQPLTFGTVESSSSIASISAWGNDQFSIYSLDGQLVKQGFIQSQEQLFAGLLPGEYIVRCGNQSQKVQFATTVDALPRFAPYSNVALPVAAPAFAGETAETALQFSIPGIDPQCALSTVDSLTFSSDLQSVNLIRQGVTSCFSIAEVTSITFPSFEATVNLEYSENDVVGVNPYFFDGLEVVNNGAGVTVTNHNLLTAEIEYVLSGSSTNGYFRINSDYKWKATLMGLSLTNPTGSVILGLTGKKGTVKSQNGYVNTLSDGASYTVITDVDQKGAIFSEGQLVFSGKGTLNVSSLAKHAICSDDYVSFENGEVKVLSAAGDAVHANDSVLVQAGTITLASSSDGIDCEGPVTIRKGEKGIPTLTITTTANGAKGIKTAADFLMSDGNVTINQTGGPDKTDGNTSNVIAIKADGNITILGGVLTINNTADGGKGLSAGGSIAISESASVRQ